MSEVTNAVRELGALVHAAAPAIAAATDKERNNALDAMAKALSLDTEEILSANRRDMEDAEANGVPSVMMDRLRLDASRIAAMSEGIRALIDLPCPTGKEETWTRPSGITITRRRVPLGVVAIIYEARPNVTADAAALCIKSGNAAILRGGKEALATNSAIIASLRRALRCAGLPEDALALIPSPSREGAEALMQLRESVDVLIPRGGRALIRNCVENASVPVIETGAGNCHIYVDCDVDIEGAVVVCVNAKCQRPSVCNAAETLLVHRDVAATFLPRFYEATRPFHLELRGCKRTLAILPNICLATEEDFATEYNDYIMSVKIVDSCEEAIAHIGRYGTHHSEAILTNNQKAADLFCREVDAAAVYHNASTRFTDGGEFGFGAEIGISTQKLHARGPMGLDALTTIKYIISGNNSIRK